MGWRTSEIISFYYEQQPWQGKSQEQVENEMIDAVGELVIANGKLMDHALEALQMAQGITDKVGLASSSPLRLIEKITSGFGIENYFKVKCSAEFEPFGKPHPAVFLKAAQFLNAEPYHCVVLEDSLNGVIAGKSARMRVIAVPEPNSPYLPKFTVSDYVLNSLEELKEDMFRLL
jgi:sugar-phosphatase